MHEMDVSIFYSKSIICKLYIQIKPAQWIKSHANSGQLAGWYLESRSAPWAKHDDCMGTYEHIKSINIGFKF